jgi:hypothetical protein
MSPEKQYDPQVYKRLELVRKQFQQNAVEKKKKEAAERKQRFISFFTRFKGSLPRVITYVILAALLIAIIWVLVASR